MERDSKLLSALVHAVSNAVGRPDSHLFGAGLNAESIEGSVVAPYAVGSCENDRLFPSIY